MKQDKVMLGQNLAELERQAKWLADEKAKGRPERLEPWPDLEVFKDDIEHLRRVFARLGANFEAEKLIAAKARGEAIDEREMNSATRAKIRADIEELGDRITFLGHKAHQDAGHLSGEIAALRGHVDKLEAQLAIKLTLWQRVRAVFVR